MIVQLLKKPFIIVVAAIMGFGFPGCQSRQDTDEHIAQRQRRQVSRRAASLLVTAQEAYRQGEYALALVLTDSLEQTNPDLADLHFLRGRIYGSMKQSEKAQAAYEQVLQIDPEYHGAWLNLGNLLMRNGEPRAALTRYQHEQEGHLSSNLALQMGKAHMQIGEVDSAAYWFTTARELDNTSSAPSMWLGQLWDDEGEFRKALDVSRQGLALDPENVNYQYLVGALMVKTGDFYQAIRHLQKVTGAWPWHPGAHYNLGQAYLRVGQQDKGEKYLVLADSLQKQQEEIEELEGLADLNPNQTGRWIRLGNAYRAAGRIQDAIEAYGIASGLEPWNLAIQTNIAVLNIMKGDTLGAINRYRKILQQDPSFADGWLNLGVAYANLGQLTRARDAFRRALECDPGHKLAERYLALMDQMEK